MKLVRDWAFWAFMGLAGSTAIFAGVLVWQQAHEAAKLERIDGHLEANDRRDQKSIVDRHQLNDRLDKAEQQQAQIHSNVSYLKGVVDQAIAKDRERQKAREAAKK